MIEAALSDARAELAALDARREELETLIAQAEAALGGTQTQETEPQMTLHDALVLILRENDHKPMTARELADAVTERGLYRKRDGSRVEINQIHARTNNYDAIFEKDGTLIGLRGESIFANHPPSITPFRDDDDGFFAWLEANPDGYLINAERNPKPNYLVLHRSGCPHFKGGASVTHWTKDYVKFCSRDRQDLEAWAVSEIHGEVTLCRTCFG